MGLSVSGLGSSGIDVSSLVSQLMSIERAPQDRLSAQKTSSLSRSTTWGSISTQLTQLQAAVDAVKTPSAVKTSTVTASDPSVMTATATGAAAASSVTLRVTSLAAAQQQASAGFASTSSLVGTGSFLVAGGAAAAGLSSMTPAGIADGRHSLTVTAGATAGGSATITLDGTAYTVSPGSGPTTIGGLTIDASSLTTGATVDFSVASADSNTTLAGLAASFAGIGGPAAAAAVDLGSGATPARLVLSAATAGSAKALMVGGSGDLAALASGTTVTRPASDAVIQMGTLTMTRPSNTVDDLLPGVSMTLLKADPDHDLTLSVGRDASGTSAKVKALVDGLNSALDLLDKSSSYDLVNSKGSALSGDSRVRELTRALTGMGSVTTAGSTATMGQLGISLTRDGRYTFDSAAFSKQLTADSDGVANLVSQASTTVGGVLDSALGTLGKKGWISVAQEGETSTQKQLQDGIDAWDTRLTDMEARYRSQYAALDAAISQLNSQRSWLSSTITSLAAQSQG
jgi:flagellar hook-associated protein 2